MAVLASVVSGLVTYVTLALVINANHPRVARSYWVSGDATWKGLDPFAVYPETWQNIGLDGLLVVDPNLNPPTMLPIFQAMALTDMRLAAVIWTVVSALLFYGACWALIRHYKPHPIAIPWLLLSPIFAENLILGQTYNLLFAIGTAGWLLLDKKRDVAAGLCIGLLCAFKPNFGVWPLYLLLSGRWRPAIAAGLLAASLGLSSVLLYGVTTYQQYFAALSSDMHHILPSDASINGALLRFGIGYGKVFGFGLVIVTGLWCWRRKPAEPSAAALVIAILASPLAWAHYALLTFPAFLARRWTVLSATCAVLLSVPPAIIASAYWVPEAAPWVGLFFPAVLLVTLWAFLKVTPIALQPSSGAVKREGTENSG